MEYRLNPEVDMDWVDPRIGLGPVFLQHAWVGFGKVLKVSNLCKIRIIINRILYFLIRCSGNVVLELF